MAHDSTPRPPAQRRRQRLPRHQSPPFAAPILLLVLLLVVPATTAGAIGWPFGWSNNKGGRGQDGDATCEAALLVGDGNGAATAAATAEERVLSSSASSGGGEKQHLATFQARRKHTADLEGACVFWGSYICICGHLASHRLCMYMYTYGSHDHRRP